MPKVQLIEWKKVAARDLELLHTAISTEQENLVGLS